MHEHRPSYASRLPDADELEVIQLSVLQQPRARGAREAASLTWRRQLAELRD